MSKYLIIYGDDNSFIVTEAISLRAAVFKFAEFTGTKLEPIFERAVRAMNTPEEIVEMFNRLTQYAEPIKTVYKIEKQVFPEPVTAREDGETNG